MRTPAFTRRRFEFATEPAIEIARGSFPDLALAFIELPMSAFDPIEVAGRGAYPLLFEIAFINPYSGKILATRGITSRTAVAFVTESMRPLHTGDFAGLWLKFLYFFCGLLLTTISFSGMMVWAKRSVRASGELLSATRQASLPQAAE